MKMTNGGGRIALNLDKTEGGGCVYIVPSLSNCKLSSLESINALIYHGDEKTNINKMNLVLKECRCLVYINTIDHRIKEFLESNYEIYEILEIPVGYGIGIQYHIFIRNTLSSMVSYARPKAATNIRTFNMADVKNKLIATLKKKKRKMDYVEEFINSL